MMLAASLPDLMSARIGAVVANPAMDRIFRSRNGDVGKHAARTAEDVVFQLDAFIDGDVVLHLHSIADLDVIADVDVLSERAVLSDPGSRLYMTEMPYFCTLAYRYIVVDV